MHWCMEFAHTEIYMQLSMVKRTGTLSHKYQCLLSIGGLEQFADYIFLMNTDFEAFFATALKMKYEPSTLN